MSERAQRVVLYLELARAAEWRQKRFVRDKLLVLAAAEAARLGRHQLAGFCRRRVLEHNPGHMLRDWESVSLALADERFQTYLRRVEAAFPPEKAELIARSLELALPRVRETALAAADHQLAADNRGDPLRALGIDVAGLVDWFAVRPSAVATSDAHQRRLQQAATALEGQSGRQPRPAGKRSTARSQRLYGQQAPGRMLGLIVAGALILLTGLLLVQLLLLSGRY